MDRVAVDEDAGGDTSDHPSTDDRITAPGSTVSTARRMSSGIAPRTNTSSPATRPAPRARIAMSHAS